MAKKLSRQQKAANTRKKQSKIAEGSKEATKDYPWKVSENQIGQTLRIRLPSDFKFTDGPKLAPSSILTLCGKLEDAIMLLEIRISNSIAKINSLM